MQFWDDIYVYVTVDIALRGLVVFAKSEIWFYYAGNSLESLSREGYARVFQYRLGHFANSVDRRTVTTPILADCKWLEHSIC
jgi:type 1 glutamine amidotransferase